MSVNKAVTRLHNDLHKLHQREREHRKDVKELHKDERELKKDRKAGDKLHKELKKDRRVADRAGDGVKRISDAEKKELKGLEAQKRDLEQQYQDSMATTPGGDPAIKAQLDAVTQKETDTLAKYGAKLDAAHEKLDAARAEVKKDRSGILHKRNEIKHDRNQVKHDRKVVKHDHEQLHNARHKALKDLHPAELHMGLKGTNRVRKDLGLKAVDHVIRNGVGHVTSTMRRLASAGRAAAMSMGGYTSGGLCATGVSKAIANAMGIRVYGNGNQIDNNLPKDKFRQIHIPLAKALKIPGLILTWEHTSTSAGRIYGHTAITTGDGHSSCSDFIENDTLAGNRSRTGLKIFMPI